MPPDPPVDFGTILRQARERQGLTLRQIAEATKISVPALDALERNDRSHLPGGIFTRAFVRAFAREVGLDPEQAVRDFVGQFPEEDPSAVTRPSRAAHREEYPDDHGGRTVRLVTRGFTVLAFIGIVIAYLAWSGRLASWRGGGSRSASASTAAAVQAPPVVSPGAAEPVLTQAASQAGQPPLPASGGAAPPAPPAVAADLTAAPAPATNPIPEGVLRFRLAPRGDCWISLRVDGTPVVSGLMTAGETREVDTRGVVSLTIGDAGVFDFSINGEPGRSLGGPGQVVTAVVTAANYTTFLVPR